MEENRKGSNNTILLTILSVATLLVAIVGATFAYFTAIVTDGDKGSSVVIQTATLSIIYHDGNNLTASGIIPGWSDTKSIEIENSTNYAAMYTLRWKPGMFNDLEDKTELIYSVNCTGDEAPAPIVGAIVPGTDPATTDPINIYSMQRIPSNTSHVCTLSLEFKEMNSAQNYNQARTFYGTLELVAEAVSTENP